MFLSVPESQFRAPFEEELPFEVLHLEGELFFGGAGVTDLFDEVHEAGRVGEVVAESRGLLAELVEDEVRTQLAEPILAIPGVGLAAVLDGVPVASFGGVQILSDVVGLFPKVMSKPQPGKASERRVAVYCGNAEHRHGVESVEGRVGFHPWSRGLEWHERGFEECGDRLGEGHGWKVVL
jgi:hypothetical protein